MRVKLNEMYTFLKPAPPLNIVMADLCWPQLLLCASSPMGNRVEVFTVRQVKGIWTWDIRADDQKLIPQGFKGGQRKVQDNRG